jgi:ankyrin repeat protein
MAAQEGHTAVVAALLEARADVNAAKNDGATPLFMAAQKGHTAVVAALLEARADVNAATDDGATPLFIAAQDGPHCGRGCAPRGAR